MNYLIYLIECPITNIPIYVGQTRNLQKRKRKHLYLSAKQPKGKLQCWIKSVLNKDLEPTFVILENCSIEDVDFWEQHYISLYKSFGFELKNIAFGGHFNKIFSHETKQKLRLKNIGKKQSLETIEKRRISLLKTWQNEELRNLKSAQSKKLNELGIIGTKGMPSKNLGKPFTGNIAKLKASLTEYWSDNEKKTNEAIKKGGKTFYVYELKSIKRANRYRKETIVEKGKLLHIFINKSEASKTLKIERNHIRRCLNGDLKSVKNLIFSYESE